VETKNPGQRELVRGCLAYGGGGDELYSRRGLPGRQFFEGVFFAHSAHLIASILVTRVLH
jgi:hypothetical protein